jgi:DNA-binding CsgD family transcriptional regulator
MVMRGYSSPLELIPRMKAGVSKIQKNKTLPVSRGDVSNPSRLESGKSSLPLPDKSFSLFCPESPEPPCPLGAAMFSQEAWKEIARSLRLSGQELRIVRGVFDDCTEFAIAGNLKVSPHTVHTHCERLYRKIGVTDRVKLVLRVMNEYFALTLSSDSPLPPLCANFDAGRCPLRGSRV